MKKIGKIISVFKPLPLTVALVVVFCLFNSLAIFAQNGPNYNIPADQMPAQNAPPPDNVPQQQGPDYGDPNANANADQLNKTCQDLGKFIEVENKKYRDFMDTNFQNKSSTSSLLDTGIEKYHEYRTTLMNELAKYAPKPGALQLTEGIDNGVCSNMVQAALSDAQRLIKSKATQTSAVKETTALITKYQTINAQLRVLSQSFMTMKSYMDTFSTKLPCYVKKGCNKG